MYKKAESGNQGFTEPMQINQRTRLRLACDIALLLAVLIVGTLTVFSFAVSTVEIGEQRFYGETQNIFDFIWKADNSIINQIKESIEQISDADIAAEDTTSAVDYAMKLIRLIFLLVPAVVVIIKTVVNLLRALYHFCKRESVKLGGVAVDNIAQNLMVYVFFVFFGSISGGIGEDAYFVGYTVGKGMTVGMLIGLVLVIAVTICTYKLNKSNVSEETDGYGKWFKVLSSGIGYMCIAIVLTFMRIYSIFIHVFSSSLSTAILSIQSGFEIKLLIFPVLNLFLLAACLSINRRVMTGFTGAFKYLLSYGNKNELGAKKKKMIDKTSSMSFIPVIILSILSVGAVYVLSDPSWGYGWSVDIYKYLVYIFIVASVAQTLQSVFTDKGKVNK